MIMTFNLTHLRFFYDAALNGSITLSAKKNSVSQPALSQGIRKLEQDLKVSLLAHEKNRFSLTEEGRIVFEQARAIFNSIDQLQETLESSQKEISGKVVIACTNSLARFFIPDLLLKARKEYPKLNIQFQRGSVKFVEASLEQVDFGLLLLRKEMTHSEIKIIKEGYFQVYQPKSKEVDGVYVDDYKSPEVKKLIQHAPHLELLGELSSWGMVEQFVKKGLGMGFLPDFFELDKPCTIKPLPLKTPAIPYKIAAVQSKGKSLTRASKAIIELLS